MPDTIGDLARQDIYPDEQYMQPPQNAVGGLTPEDWMMSGQQPPQATYDYVPPQSWLQKAGDLARRDVANYQTGGVPAMMGQLAADSSGEQDLAGGFGGNIKGVESKIGALADLAPHAPPFYSAVENAVQGAKQTTAPGQQWAGFLRNQPGVKPEELNTLKLGDLFDQTGAVTKQDLLDHIAANKVQLGEVVKGAPDPSAAQLEKVAQERYGTSLSDPYLTEGQRMAVRDEAMSQSGAAPTKFSSYTLPGGENYREMLLTLPITNVEKAKFERMTALEQKLRNPADYDAPELNALRAEYKQLADETRNVGAFQSSHYDEPNILAHVRYNDRVIDGKKTLFVEEVQSDWHQKGKREGYQSDSTLTPDESSELRSLQQRYDLHNEGSGGNFSGDDLTRMSDLQSKLGKNTGVPDAPFKTTWPDLAMKRVIREAAEKGYDKVAWTPGSVQADRYDLSKQIDKISTYRLQNAGELELKDGQPQYRIEAFKNGSLAVDKYVTENELADHVGKELADKIIKQENGARSYSGLDLKVGGEGMKGFYDQILPAAVNKIVKKAGGRVGEGDINVTPPSSDAAGSGLQIRPAGGRYEVFDTNTGALEQRFDTLQEARDHLSGIREAERPRKVHTLDITPQLREMALKKGFPLFAAGGLVAGGAMGDLAKQDEYQ
jgi:hypothetical protein